jgi:hypothetical protein
MSWQPRALKRLVLEGSLTFLTDAIPHDVVRGNFRNE